MDLACAYLEMAIELLRAVPLIGARLTESKCQESLGDVWLARGKPEESRRWYEKSYDACQRFEFSKRQIAEKLAAMEQPKAN